MFDFIKKIFTSEKIEKNTSDELTAFYHNKTKNLIWNDYIKLNKYEKLFAYSLKDINDIEIINALRNAYFNPVDYYMNGSLSKEIKVKIKSLKIFLKDIHSLQTNNSTILQNLLRFIDIEKLPLSQYIRIASYKLMNSPEIEKELHNFVFHRNSKELYKFLPPNHPEDRSHIMLIKEKDFNKFDAIKVSTKYDTKNQHEDYDFCTSQYIIEQYKNTQ